MAAGTPYPHSKAPIVLWVEDDLTMEYLSACWGDNRFGFPVAHSCDGVRTATEVAQRDGYPHVFGFVDRDFGRSNESKWSVAGRTFSLFVPEVHETESYLLDFKALESISGARLSESDLRSEAQRLADEWIWWTAARTVLSHWDEAMRLDFPKHPKSEAVKSQSDATGILFAAISSASSAFWYRNLTQAEVDAAVVAAHSVLRALTPDGLLLATPGKELFRRIRGTVWTQTKGVQADTDVAKLVAMHQSVSGSVPASVVDLRKALLVRAGLAT